MAKRKVIHVVGTGTIGEPLIGMLVDNAKDFGLDEVTFHKNTPLSSDRPKPACGTARTSPSERLDRTTAPTWTMMDRCDCLSCLPPSPPRSAWPRPYLRWPTPLPRGQGAPRGHTAPHGKSRG